MDATFDRHTISMEHIEIAADGDILFVINETLELRVSASTLRTTSPVFKAMLGPSFAEGQVIRSNTTPSIPRIQLPDDESAGMTLLCAALHLRNDLLPEKPTSHQVLAFASASDKYDCNGAVKYTAKHWLDTFSDDDFEKEPQAHLLAAYRLDNAESFAKITNYLSKSGGITRAEVFEGVDFSGPLGGLQESMELRAEQAVKSLRDAISTIGTETAWYLRADLLHLPDTHRKARSGTSDTCNLTQNLVSEYQKMMIDAGIWRSQGQVIKLPTLTRRIAKLVAPIWKSNMACTSSLCRGRDLFSDFKKQVEALKWDADCVLAGVCLDCFKAGGRLKGHCRVDHPK